MKTNAMIYGPRGFARKLGMEVSDERWFEIFLNSRSISGLYASPKDLRELVPGFLVSKGLLRYDEAERCQVAVEGNKLRAETPGEPQTSELKPIESTHTFSGRVIADSTRGLDGLSGEWKITGGTHCTALFSREGELLAGFEDISRHNSIDKLIGWASLNKCDPRDKFMLSTGRIGGEMARRMVKVGIPLIASKRAVLLGAIEISERFNLTLIGSARENEFTVYANPERIIE